MALDSIRRVFLKIDNSPFIHRNAISALHNSPARLHFKHITAETNASAPAQTMPDGWDFRNETLEPLPGVIDVKGTWH
jgi:hypothetical protein